MKRSRSKLKKLSQSSNQGLLNASTAGEMVVAVKGASVTEKATEILQTMIDGFLTLIVSVFVPTTITIEKRYPLVLKLLTYLRALFLIFIVIIIIWSSVEAEGTATPLYHLYSILKSVSIILIMISAGLVAVSNVKRALGTDATDQTPTEINVLYSFMYLLPYMYDLIAIVLLLGILKAYYIRGCGNKYPNVYKFLNIMIVGPMVIIAASMLFTILTRALQVPLELRGSLKKLTGPLLGISGAMLLIHGGLEFIERMVTNNLAFWLNLYDGAVSSENCQGEGKSKDDDGDGLEKAKNIIISVVLGILVLVIFVIQIVPVPQVMTVNVKLRDAAVKSVHALVNVVANST